MKKLLPILILLSSCSSQTNEQTAGNDITNTPIDSTELYAFFKGKISTTWDYSLENDSVEYQFNAYGLPESRSHFEMIGSHNVQFSIVYTYNISDSAETVNHMQQFGGGRFLTEIRKFGKNCQVIWKEEIDEFNTHKRTEYNESGVMISLETIPLY